MAIPLAVLAFTVSFGGLPVTPTSARSPKIGQVYDVDGMGMLTRQAGRLGRWP